MKQKLLKLTTGLHMAPLLNARMPYRIPSAFYGVQRTGFDMPNTAESGTTRVQILDTTNHIRFYNDISIKISVQSYHRTITKKLPPLPIYSANVSGVAANIINQALRDELDREISIMARGKTIASNQRREKMLGKYLLSKPYQVIQRFYGANMMCLETGAQTSVASVNHFTAISSTKQSGKGDSMMNENVK